MLAVCIDPEAQPTTLQKYVIYMAFGLLLFVMAIFIIVASEGKMEYIILSYLLYTLGAITFVVNGIRYLIDVHSHEKSIEEEQDRANTSPTASTDVENPTFVTLANVIPLSEVTQDTYGSITETPYAQAINGV